jgi:hypothetical protein
MYRKVDPSASFRTFHLLSFTPNQQLDQAVLDQGLREVEQLLHAQGGKTLEDFELPIPA